MSKHGSPRERIEPTLEPFDDVRAAQAIHPNERPEGRLDFEAGDLRGGHAGDVGADAFDAERVRLAGQTGGEVPGIDITDDDLSPETLFDEPGLHSTDRDSDLVSDLNLTTAAGGSLGLGDGPDEAEIAELDPVGALEALRLRKRIHDHAGDPNQFEPAEANELRARSEALLAHAQEKQQA